MVGWRSCATCLNPSNGYFCGCSWDPTKSRQEADTTLKRLPNGLLAVQNKAGDVVIKLKQKNKDNLDKIAGLKQQLAALEQQNVDLDQQELMTSALNTMSVGTKFDDAHHDVSFSRWVQDDCEGGLPEDFQSERHRIFVMK